jgi:hypothetical protein
VTNHLYHGYKYYIDIVGTTSVTSGRGTVTRDVAIDRKVWGGILRKGSESGERRGSRFRRGPISAKLN